MRITNQDLRIIFEAIELGEGNNQFDITLTPGQALLEIITRARAYQISSDILQKLYALYLEGISNKYERRIYQQLINCLKSHSLFDITHDIDALNHDQSRRYFETHLSYHILNNSSTLLNPKNLRHYQQRLHGVLYQLPGFTAAKNKAYMETLNGEQKVFHFPLNFEFGELIYRLMKGDYHQLSQANCYVLCEIARIMMTSRLITEYKPMLPVDVYSEGLFKFGVDGRGRGYKPVSFNAVSHTKGILKSSMAIPSNDLAYTSKKDIYPITRPADLANPIHESGYVHAVFKRLTQVYVNGISSTTLACLRVLEHLRLKEQFPDIDFHDFMSVYASLMVFNGGGHSFYEIFEVLKYPQFNLLSLTHHLLATSIRKDLLVYFLLERQPDEFEQALDETLFYQKTWMAKQAALRQIRHGIPQLTASAAASETYELLKSLSRDGKIIHQAVFYNDLDMLRQLPSHLKQLNQKDEYGLTPIMLAANLGNLDAVNILIAKNVSLTHVVDLAVRFGHYHIVHDICKKRYPLFLDNALQLAASRQNIGILWCLLSSEQYVSKDVAITRALHEAVKSDNIGCVLVLFQSVQFKRSLTGVAPSLLHEASLLGHTQMVDLILEHCPTINARQIVNALHGAVHHGFVSLIYYYVEYFAINPTPVLTHRIISDLVVNSWRHTDSRPLRSIIGLACQHLPSDIKMSLLPAMINCGFSDAAYILLDSMSRADLQKQPSILVMNIMKMLVHKGESNWFDLFDKKLAMRFLLSDFNLLLESINQNHFDMTDNLINRLKEASYQSQAELNLLLAYTIPRKHHRLALLLITHGAVRMTSGTDIYSHFISDFKTLPKKTEDKSRHQWIEKSLVELKENLSDEEVSNQSQVGFFNQRRLIKPAFAHSSTGFLPKKF